jgi:alkylhydroperoxidase/carboxymuconolactone decarboxylase family protein YurZ
VAYEQEIEGQWRFCASGGLPAGICARGSKATNRSRPSLSIRIRRVLALALSAANSQTSAVKRHVRVAPHAGLTRDEIGEVLLHAYRYAGCYAALEAFTAAKEVFDELDRAAGAAPASTGSGMNAAEPAKIDIPDKTAAWSRRPRHCLGGARLADPPRNPRP